MEMMIMRKKKINPFKQVNTFLKIDNTILRQVKKNKSIIYGAQSIKKQIGNLRARKTIDWDIFSHSPKKSANQLQRKLDKQSGGNNFYQTPSQYHKQTFKVYGNGLDGVPKTKDDVGVADFTKPEKKIRTVIVDGIRYSHLSESEKDKKASLASEEFAFRHKKDKDDLERIQLYNKLKKDKFLKNFLIKPG